MSTGLVVPEPGKITLEEALKSVGAGLIELRMHDPKTGLVVTEVDVTFNISANAKDTSGGKLYVEAGASAAKTFEIIKAGAEAGFTSELVAARGNTITLKFRNLLTLGTKETVAGRLKDDVLNGLAAQIKPFATDVPIK